MSNEPLTFESLAGKSENTRIIRLNGPLVLANLFEFQEELRNHPSQTTILDLSGVPYMDSAGMGAIINYYVSCQKNGNKFIAAAPNYRVLELFKMTKVDALITIAATIDEAEAL